MSHVVVLIDDRLKLSFGKFIKMYLNSVRAKDHCAYRPGYLVFDILSSGHCTKIEVLH